jgi:hypothetical protein
MLYQLERDEMMIIYGDVHRAREKEVRLLFQQVPGNIGKKCNKLQ